MLVLEVHRANADHSLWQLGSRMQDSGSEMSPTIVVRRSRSLCRYIHRTSETLAFEFPLQLAFVGSGHLGIGGLHGYPDNAGVGLVIWEMIQC